MRIQPHLVNMCVQGVKVDLDLREQINKQLIHYVYKNEKISLIYTQRYGLRVSTGIPKIF